jgi:2-polyprenyl-3-methyl-5-hydroxy-6-metoxy-1,4-benzoquinol methylase
MDTEKWHNVKELIDRQLRLQVDMLFEQHNNYFSKDGLLETNTILDIGTGNGVFLEKLAEKHPNKKFYGIDIQEHLIDEAKRNQRCANVNYIHVETNDYSKYLDTKRVDAVIMRYLILHMPNVRNFLYNLKNQLSKSTKIWILDVDLNYFLCEPENIGFERLKLFVEEFCVTQSESNALSDVVDIMNSLDYKQIRKDRNNCSSQSLNIKMFKEFIKNELECYLGLSDLELSNADKILIDNFIESDIDSGKYFVQYGMGTVNAIV